MDRSLSSCRWEHNRSLSHRRPQGAFPMVHRIWGGAARLASFFSQSAGVGLRARGHVGTSHAERVLEYRHGLHLLRCERPSRSRLTRGKALQRGLCLQQLAIGRLARRWLAGRVRRRFAHLRQSEPGEPQAGDGGELESRGGVRAASRAGDHPVQRDPDRGVRTRR